MKKLLSFALALTLIALSAAPALAHSSRHSNKNIGYSVCAVQDCAKTSLHIHSGKIYSAHHNSDGHSYHDYCNFENCTLIGQHSHNSTPSHHHKNRGHH